MTICQFRGTCICIPATTKSTRCSRCGIGPARSLTSPSCLNRLIFRLLRLHLLRCFSGYVLGRFGLGCMATGCLATVSRVWPLAKAPPDGAQDPLYTHLYTPTCIRRRGLSGAVESRGSDHSTRKVRISVVRAPYALSANGERGFAPGVRLGSQLMTARVKMLRRPAHLARAFFIPSQLC
jgi:hypothetical protein